MPMNVQASATLPDKINQIRLLTADIINKEIHDELRAMQGQYDKETSHSRLPEEQLKWNAFIRVELNKLEAFR